LAAFGDRVEILATNFASYIPSGPALMVLADLGVSSPQLDVAERGFSFRLDGPLDMRMSPDSDVETAAELIDRLEENALADLIYGYGEERLSRRIARRIKADLAAQGAYDGTAALAYAVAGCYPPKARRGRIHPATRTFQALRIAVNDELAVLDRLLEQAPDWLEPGGLMGVISFHSRIGALRRRFCGMSGSSASRANPPWLRRMSRTATPAAAAPNGDWPVELSVAEQACLVVVVE
jgi:16S rRNA (cytosine1402-N4)-methyltransferase